MLKWLVLLIWLGLELAMRSRSEVSIEDQVGHSLKAEAGRNSGGWFGGGGGVRDEGTKGLGGSKGLGIFSVVGGVGGGFELVSW